MIQEQYKEDYLESIENDPQLSPLNPKEMTSFEFDNLGFIEYGFVLYKKVLRKQKLKRKIDVCIVISKGNSFNAYSLKSKNIDNLYYIVINRGLLIRLWSLIELFGMNDKGRIKDKYRIDDRTKTFQQILCADIEIFNLYYKQWYSQQNKNSLEIILFSTIEHIIYHEYAHILHGHVDWLSIQSKNNKSSDRKQNKDQILRYNNDKKFMEYRADDTAVWMSINDNLDKISPLLSKVSYEFKIEQFVSHYLFGTMILSHCFEDFDESIFENTNTAYPHPEIRANIIYSSLKNYIIQIFDSKDVAYLYEEVNEGFRSVHLALSKYLPHKPFPNSFSEENPGNWLLNEVAEYNKRSRADNEAWNTYDLFIRKQA